MTNRDLLIVLGFAVAVLGALLGGYYGLRATATVERDFARMTDETLPVQRALLDLRFNALRVEDVVREIAFFSARSPDRASLRSFLDLQGVELRRAKGGFEEALARYRTFIQLHFPDELATRDRILETAAEFLEQAAAVVRDDGRDVGQSGSYLKDLHGARDALYVAIDAALAVEEAELAARRGAVNAAIQGAKETIGNVTVLALLLSILFGAAVWRHIQQRVQGQRELESSYSMVRATLESTADGILVVNPRLELVEHNRRFQDLWEIREETLALRGFTPVLEEMALRLASTGRDEFVNIANLLCYDGEDMRTGECRLQDGRVFEYYTQPHRILGRSVGRVWSFRDITARVRAERQLKAANEELEGRVAQRTGELTEANLSLRREIGERKRVEDSLREQQSHMRIVLENVADGIITTAEDGVVRSFNPAAQHLFGFMPEEVLSQRVSLLIPDLYTRRAAAASGTRPAGMAVGTHELYGVRRDGTAFPVEVVVREVALLGARLYVTVVRDITRQKEQEAALIRARELALRASRMKSEFLANMTHEIRTPMNGMLGMLTLLRETPLDDEQREYADVAKRSGDALLVLLNDILDFSKIEAGRMELERVEFDLPMLVEDVVVLAGSRAYAKGLELGLVVAPTVPHWVRGDPTRLRQILGNLVGNAIKFTEKGEVSVAVDLLRGDDQTCVLRFEICDTGIGIPVEAQRGIFNPFSQADSSITRRYGGSGLGLAISREIVEMMGGEISVASEPGEGSTFSFTVCLERIPERAAPQTPRHDLTGVRMLIVDDSEVSRKFLAYLARSWHMTVEEAVDGAAALERMRAAAAEGAPFDVVLVDRVMPSMSGIELARAVRAEPAIAGARLVMVTRYGERGEGQAAREAGISGYLSKPVRESQLFECIAMVLGHAAGDGDLVTRHSLAEHARTNQRILVVEDNEVNQAVARGMLGKLGYQVDVAGDGEEALRMMDERAFDLVFMDCQMPGLDGYETTRRQRRREEDRGAARMPIVAMTAHALQGDRARCLAAGMDDYLAKPVRPAELREILGRWLHGTVVETRSEGSADTPPAQDAPIERAKLEELRDLLGDGFPELVNAFLEDAPQRIDVLRGALSLGDSEAIRGAAHALKGASGNVGAGLLSDLCHRLEEASRGGSLEDVPRHVQRISEEFARVREVLSEFA